MGFVLAVGGAELEYAKFIYYITRSSDASNRFTGKFSPFKAVRFYYINITCSTKV